MTTTLSVGFIPLIDAAPLIVAEEMGFAAEEGLALDMVRAPSWSALRDQLSFGRVDAAHMLSPVPVATALGLGGGGVALEALSVLSVNGNVIGVSRPLAARLRDAGHSFGFNDARAAGDALISGHKQAGGGDTLRIGVPFPFSMHAELVFYWLSAMGLPAPQSIRIRSVPPPLMADAMEAGEVDAFCVGEPWGSRAVDAGVAELLLPGAAIWAFAPEKVLAVRAEFARNEPALSHRLIRACWRAARWLSQPDSIVLAGELLSQPRYLDLPPEVLERAFRGHLIISPAGETRHVPHFVDFFSGVAGFPWRSQAEWIGQQLAARTGLERDSAATAARAVFRSDIYRSAMIDVAPDLPKASSKLEGALHVEEAAGSTGGRLILPRDAFFDGRIFEPHQV